MKRSLPRLEGAARDTARGELIGLQAAIVQSQDQGLVGFAGTIVDETLRTFTLRRADGRESRIGKVGNLFEVHGPRGPVRIPGEAIEFRPAERTKKVR